MRKTLTALATAATFAAASIAAPTTADARWRGGGFFLGGLAAGAIIGSAFARPYYGGYYGGYGGYGGYGYGGYGGYGGYYPAPAYYGYYAPAPVYYNYYAPSPYYGCWRWRYGYRYRVC